MKYQFFFFLSIKDSERYGTAEETLNKYNCVAKVASQYYYTHSIFSNIGEACKEAFKFSPTNISWSDASSTTDTTNYLNGVRKYVPDGSDPIGAVAAYRTLTIIKVSMVISEIY